MNAEQIEDLKQFISASISQSEARLRGETSQTIKDEVGKLREDMHEEFLGVGEAIEEIHRQLDEQDKQRVTEIAAIEKRLTKLEHQVA